MVLARAHDVWRGPLARHARQDGATVTAAALSRQAPWGPSVQEGRDPQTWAHPEGWGDAEARNPGPGECLPRQVLPSRRRKPGRSRSLGCSHTGAGSYHCAPGTRPQPSSRSGGHGAGVNRTTRLALAPGSRSAPSPRHAPPQPDSPSGHAVRLQSQVPYPCLLEQSGEGRPVSNT